MTVTALPRLSSRPTKGDFMSVEVAPSEEEALIHDEFNRLRGRLCGLIESWGLPTRQERAAVQTLKTLTYDSEAVFIKLLDEQLD